MFVYILQHAYDYGKNGEHQEVKFLGVFSSKLKAQKAIMKYVNLPGFREYGVDCFFIDKYKIDEMEWKEGFIETD